MAPNRQCRIYKTQRNKVEIVGIVEESLAYIAIEKIVNVCGGIFMYFGQTRPMEVYDRQIRYLDYMENGVRTKGAGFIKLERQNDQCSISLQVSGLYRKDCFTRPFLLLDEQGERELCRIKLTDGGIKLYLDRLDCNNLDGQGLSYEQLNGFRIPISEGKEILCKLGEPRQKPVNSPVEQPATEMFVSERLQSEVSEFIPLCDIVPKVEISKIEESQPLSDVAECETGTSQELVVGSIKEDKWEQLWAIYPHKCPFSDDREYLAVGPGDFVVLSERNYKLVNNSFLLHGYYNHHHLILTRIRERNKMCYYIGVPGNFFEREKRTAIMFGFKSFECAIEPAQEGDFGYYMMPVEL